MTDNRTAAREREANFCAILLAAKRERVLALTLGLDTAQLVDPMARWLVLEVVKRIHTGYRYADLRPYADDAQRAYLDSLRQRYVSDATGEVLLAEIKAAHRQSEQQLILRRGLARAEAGEDVTGAVVGELTALSSPAAASRVHTAREMFGAALERVQALRDGKLRSYLPMGLPRIERALSIQPGQLVVLGGRTGSGKTALAANLAWHTAYVHEPRVPVLYLNSEMGTDEMGLRLTAIANNINLGVLRSAPDAESEAYVRGMMDEHGDKPAWTTEPLGEMTSADVLAMARYQHEFGGVEVVVVDYVQRLRDWVGRRDMSQWQTMMEITASLKTLATDLGIVVICLAQLNQTGELAASKGMANDADLVLALERCVDDTEERSQTVQVGPPKRVGGQTHLLSVMKGRHIPSDLDWPIRMEPHSLRVTEVEA